MAEKISRIQKIRLSNGLTVIFEPCDFAPVAAVNVWVKTGSSCEKPGEAGLAHFHEHMVFKGGGGLLPGALALGVESSGGRINAHTSFDHTVYHITCASRSLEENIALLARSVVSPSFPEGEIEREKEVIAEEIRRDGDAPESFISRRLFASAYKGHPYGRPILGTEKSVRSFTRKSFSDFHSKWYSPANMVVVIAGDFKPKSALAAVKKFFGKMKKTAVPKRVSVPRSARKSPVISVMKKDASEGYFAFAYGIPNFAGADLPALEIISEIMGGGESSRLFRIVKEELGFASSVHCYLYAPVMDGVFIVGGTAVPEKIAPASQRILAMFYDFARGDLPALEIDRAKLNIESDGVRSRETAQSRAHWLGFFEATAGDCSYEERHLEKIHLVNAAGIRSAALKYFTPSNLCAAVLVPKKSAVPENLIKAAILKTRPPKIPSAAKISGDSLMRALKNGIRAVVRENRNAPLFSARLLFPAGLRFEAPGAAGISNFTANMLTRGTAARSAKQIAEEMESLAGRIEGFSGTDSAGISMSALSSNFDSAMEIFCDAALNPSFSEDETQRAKREILAEISQKTDSLPSVCIDGLAAALFKGSPYARDILGTAANVRKFSGTDAEFFHRKMLSPQSLVISVVGDVSAERVFSVLEKHFGSLRKFRKVRPFPVRPRKSDGPAQRVKKLDDKQQTHIAVGFSAPKIQSADRHNFQVLNAILSGQGGRLFAKLRDEMGLAYAVSSFYSPHIDAGCFGVYIATAAEREKEALAEIAGQLRGLLSDGVTDAETERAKSKIVGDFEIGLQRNSAQASVMGFDEIYGIGWNEHKNFARKIFAVTSEEVLRTARKYLKLDSRAVSIVRGSGEPAEK